MAKVTDPSFQFWFDDDWYTAQGAESMFRLGTSDDVKTMRAEYTRMRDAAQKRVKRLEKAFPESKAAQHRYDTGKRDEKGRPIYAAGFQKLKNLDPRDFPKAFVELAKFLKAKGSTVTGQKQIKEKTIKTWQDQGLDLNQKNYDTAIKILEEMRRQKIVYDSERVVALADSMLGLSSRQKNNWLDHLSELLPNTDKVSSIMAQGTYVKVDDVLREINFIK